MKPHYERRKRRGIMLAYPFEAKRLLKWATPYWAQLKYNGHRCLGIRTSDHVELISSSGLQINSVPHIKEALYAMPPGIYDGELYLHDNFQRLCSLVSPNAPVEGCRDVHYVIFDAKLHLPQERRIIWLKQLEGYADPEIIRIAPAWACASEEDIQDLLGDAMLQGYEGLILRERYAAYIDKRATTMMKLKPRSLDVYTIVGWVEEVSIHGDPKGALGAFRVVDADGREFKVGTGFTRVQREDYWKAREELIGQRVAVRYQALTDARKPWFPVFSEVVR